MEQGGPGGAQLDSGDSAVVMRVLLLGISHPSICNLERIFNFLSIFNVIMQRSTLINNLQSPGFTDRSSHAAGSRMDKQGIPSPSGPLPNIASPPAATTLASHTIASVNQRLADSFPKGRQSKYFRLCEPPCLCPNELGHCPTKVTADSAYGNEPFCVQQTC